MVSIPERKTTSAVARLKQDYLRLKRDPIPYVSAEPNPRNILEWYYVVNGPEKSPYEGGIYHGKLVFPSEFPFRPPSIYIITPNGRFKTNTRLCLSNSDYHPDTWNPAWSVSTILTGLLSFMVEKSPTYGSIETSDSKKKQFAYQSLEFNIQNHHFCETFPEIAERIKEELEKRNDYENKETTVSLPQEVAVPDTNYSSNPFIHNGGIIANICILVSVAIFVIAVRYVVANTYMDTQDL